MKHRFYFFWLVVFVLAMLMPLHRAAMHEEIGETSQLYQVPVPPPAGRGGERSAMQWLSREPTSFSKWMSEGRRYLKRKEFEQAIWALRKAVEMSPLSYEAHFLLGVAFERRGLEGLPGDLTSWYRLAETEYKAAIALADYLPARFNLGILYERQGRLEEARREYEHILTISPSSALSKRTRIALERVVAADTMPRILSKCIPNGCSFGQNCKIEGSE